MESDRFKGQLAPAEPPDSPNRRGRHPWALYPQERPSIASVLEAKKALPSDEAVAKIKRQSRKTNAPERELETAHISAHMPLVRDRLHMCTNKYIHI